MNLTLSDLRARLDAGCTLVLRANPLGEYVAVLVDGTSEGGDVLTAAVDGCLGDDGSGNYGDQLTGVQFADGPSPEAALRAVLS